jgi:hypothetical protein
MFKYFKRRRAMREYQEALRYHQMQFAHSTALTLAQEGESLLRILKLYIECLQLGISP